MALAVTDLAAKLAVAESASDVFKADRGDKILLSTGNLISDFPQEIK